MKGRSVVDYKISKKMFLTDSVSSSAVIIAAILVLDEDFLAKNVLYQM